MPLDVQRRRRTPRGLPVRAGVDVLTEGVAGRRELSERDVLRAQVRLSGHQVGLRDPHGGLRAALGFRVERDTRVHRHAVMPPRRDEVRVPHRDPGDVLDGDGLLVVRQRIRRRPTQPAQGGVQAGDQRRQRPVPGRNHHPEPAPGQPRAEQQRRPRRPVHAGHPRPPAPVELQPHAWLGDPRPVRAPMPGPPPRLRLGDRPASRALIAVEAEHHQPLMDLVRPDRALRAVHPLLDLRQVPVDDPLPPTRPTHRPARIPRRDIRAHRLCVHARQPSRRMGATRGVERLQNLHDLPVRLLHGPSGRWLAGGRRPANQPPEGSLLSDRHAPVPGHQQGDQLSAQREAPCPPTGRLPCPLSERR